MSIHDDQHYRLALALARSEWERAAAAFLGDPANPARASAEREARCRYDRLLRTERRVPIRW